MNRLRDRWHPIKAPKGAVSAPARKSSLEVGRYPPMGCYRQLRTGPNLFMQADEISHEERQVSFCISSPSLY